MIKINFVLINKFKKILFLDFNLELFFFDKKT